MKLYWHPFSVFPRRVRIALREKAIACEEVVIDVPGGALRTPELAHLNPFGQIPVLEDGELVVSESLAILEYLEERHPAPPLLPAAPGARARVRELMAWSGDYLAPAWKGMTAPLFAQVKPDDPSVAAGRDAFARHLDVLEGRIGEHEWLAGAYSLADVSYAPFVTVLDLLGAGELLAARPRLGAWVARLAARPAVRDTAPVP